MLQTTNLLLLLLTPVLGMLLTALFVIGYQKWARVQDPNQEYIRPTLDYHVNR